MRQELSSKMRTFKGATVEKNVSVGVASVCPIYPPQYIDPPFCSGNQVRLFMSPVRGDFRGTSSALSSPSSNNASKYQIDPEPQPHPPLPPATHLSLRWKGTKKASDPPPTTSYPSSSSPSSATKKRGIKMGALMERGTLQFLFNPTPSFMWTLYTDRVFSLHRDGQL